MNPTGIRDGYDLMICVGDIVEIMKEPAVVTICVEMGSDDLKKFPHASSHILIGTDNSRWALDYRIGIPPVVSTRVIGNIFEAQQKRKREYNENSLRIHEGYRLLNCKE